MKKTRFKNKFFWLCLGSMFLVVPLIAVSAISCSQELKKSIINPDITINYGSINETVFLGQNQNLPTFSVQATINNKNAKLSYQWYKNDLNSANKGKLISGATKSNYLVSKSDTSKTGKKYFYVVVNVVVNNKILNSVTSKIFTLTITNEIPPITIQTQPVNQTTILETTNLPTFSVNASSITGAKLTYQWYKNETSSSQNWQKISGATNSTYTVPVSDVKSIGKKYYYVKIDGTFDGKPLTTVTSDVAALTIHALPSIVITKEPERWKVVSVNQTTNLPTLSVSVKNIKGAQFSYQWYKNGVLIRGATNSSYTIPASDLKNVGEIKYYAYVYTNINWVLYLTPINTITSTIKVVR